MRRPTIGVFDSGVGGLTVLKALLELVPEADYAYFGDTARLPYGSKSVETVARYAVEAAHFLESQGANLLVIACNTATALALEQIIAAVRFRSSALSVRVRVRRRLQRRTSISSCSVLRRP